MAGKVALLRGINVGGKARLAMAELRDAAERLGWTGVSTYIASGNLLFDAAGERPELEAALEAAIADRFGMAVPVIVRSAGEWAAYPALNPFPEAAEAEPNRLMLMLSRRPALAGAEAELRERARDGERIAVAGDAVWIHYPAGAGTSRLSPAMIDRAIGSPATARNYRTVTRIGQLLGC